LAKGQTAANDVPDSTARITTGSSDFSELPVFVLCVRIVLCFKHSLNNLQKQPWRILQQKCKSTRSITLLCNADESHKATPGEAAGATMKSFKTLERF
jgi:hypothetical protein